MLGFLALTACGFVPAFGPGGVAGGLRNTVQIVAPDTVAGFALRIAIEDKLGQATTPLYTLDLTLQETTEAAAITVAGDTTRFDVRGSVDWTLGSDAGGQIGSGTVRSFTSYSATGSTVATQAAAADARTRLSQTLASLVVDELILAVNE